MEWNYIQKMVIFNIFNDILISANISHLFHGVGSFSRYYKNSHIFFLMKYLFVCFVYFLIGLLIFTVEFGESFIYSRYRLFVRYVACKYFLPAAVYLFHPSIEKFFFTIWKQFIDYYSLYPDLVIFIFVFKFTDFFFPLYYFPSATEPIVTFYFGYYIFWL